MGGPLDVGTDPSAPRAPAAGPVGGPDNRTQAQKDRDAIAAGGTTGDPNEDARRAIAAREEDARREREGGPMLNFLTGGEEQGLAAKANNDRINNSYEYGGTPGGAQASVNYFNGLAIGAQSRPGEQINYGDANQDRRANQQARLGQTSIAEAMRQRALGRTPSIASMEADRQTRQLAAQQSSAAASARGPAGMALAQQGAAANTAAGESSISNSAQINAANERRSDEVSAFGAQTGIRQGDQAQQVEDAKQAQYQAALNAEQRKQNDLVTGQHYDRGIGITEFQSGAQQKRVGAEHGLYFDQQNLKNAQNADDRASFGTYAGPIIGAGATAGGIILSSFLNSGGKDAPVGANTSAGTGLAPPTDSGPAGPGGGAGDASRPGGGDGGGGAWDPYNQSNETPKSAGGSFGLGGTNILGKSVGQTTSAKTTDMKSIYSDEELKGGMHSEGHPLMHSSSAGGGASNRVDAFLDGIHPLSYHYKDPASEPRNQPTGGRYLGISAQDLESVPEVGHQMVSEGPRGKQIESGPTLSAALAGLARLNERLKKVEGPSSDAGHITSDIRAKGDVQHEGDINTAKRQAFQEGLDAPLNHDGIPEYMFTHPRGASPGGHAGTTAQRPARADESAYVSPHVLAAANARPVAASAVPPMGSMAPPAAPVGDWRQALPPGRSPDTSAAMANAITASNAQPGGPVYRRDVGPMPQQPPPGWAAGPTGPTLAQLDAFQRNGGR